MFKIDRSQVKLACPDEAAQRPERRSGERRRGEDRRSTPPHPEILAAQEQAARLIRGAEDRAREIVAAAQTQADDMRESARRAGYADGTQQAQQRLAEQTAEHAGQLEAALAELAGTRAALVDRFEGEFIELTLATAQKVVNTAIEKDDTVFEGLLQKALQRMKWEGEITVRLSHEICARLFPGGSATFVLGDKSVTAAIVDDPSVKGNGCIVESEGESINAGVDCQFRYLALAFRRRGSAEG